MLKENQAEFEILGIPKFWNKGYTGKGISIGNTEKSYLESPHLHGRVFAPEDYRHSEPTNEHGSQTAFMIHEVAPEADIYCLNMGYNNNNGVYSGTLIEETIPLIIDKKISVITSSSWKLLSEARIGKITEMLRNNTVLSAAAGNSGSDGVVGYGKYDIWLAIGAVGHRDGDEKIYQKSYSSIGLQLDYTCFSGLYTKDFRPDYPNRVFQLEGTSFSAPTFAGMCGLVQHFFLVNAGTTLNHYQMENFIKDHLIDLGDTGWDDRFGYGLFVLPDPDDIVISKYVKIVQPIEEENDMSFKDTEGHWAEQYIDFVVSKGLMVGKGDGMFEPNTPITRAEFAVVMARKEGFVPVKK